MSNENSQYAKQISELVDKARAWRDSKEQRLQNRINIEASFDLLVHALHDADLQVRWDAAWLLNRLESERTIEPLLEYVRNPENRNRGGSVRILAKLGGAPMLQPLLEMLHDPDASVRSAAMSALAYRGEASAIEPFLQAFQRVLNNEEEDAWMRYEVAMWIRLLSEKLNDKTSFASTIEGFEQLKNDGDPLVRKYALRALEWLKAS